MPASAPGIRPDLKSGHPALEFTNTVNNHAGAQPGETLFTYADLAGWMKRAGLLDESRARALLRRCESQPAQAARTLARALQLREAIYRIFVAVVKGKSPSQNDLAALNDVLGRLTRGAQVVRADGGFAWQWNADEDTLEAPLWRIALAAVELLTSEHVGRLGQCADENGCGWLFIDTSKNRSRRWCDINDCGNRAKQRRHREKARKS